MRSIVVGKDSGGGTRHLLKPLVVFRTVHGVTSGQIVAFYDEEVFSDELPDAVLEVATREFRYGCVLLRDRHLPLLSCALMMEVGPVIGAARARRARQGHGALYLIFKFAVALRQSFDDDIRSARHVDREYKKQPLADLKFVLGHKDNDSISRF